MDAEKQAKIITPLGRDNSGDGEGVAKKSRRRVLRPVRQGFVETPDHQAISYRLYGKKGPLWVLCDGIGCDGYIWKYFIPEFCKDNRVLHTHYRGHGQSSKPLDYKNLTIAQLVDDLKRVIDEVSPGEKVLLAGHSMGVQVALEFHRRFSEAVKGLVCICGSAGQALDHFMHAPFLKMAFPYLLTFFRSVPMLAEILWKITLAGPKGYYPAVLFQLTSTLCSKEDLHPYLMHLGQIDARVFMELAEDMGIHSAQDHLPQVDVPTLVCAGQRDNFTPTKKTQLLAEEIPGAQFCLMPAATHTAPLELPELLHLRIRKFYNDHFKATS